MFTPVRMSRMSVSGAAFSIVTAVFLLQSIFLPTLEANTYYVSTSGSDSNPGTIDQPFLTIPAAYNAAVAGDTIFVRGGRYSYGTTINLSKSGTSVNMYYLWAYPGERAFLDFSSMPLSSSNRGIKLSGKYWYIKGFDVYKAGDNGMNISGSYDIVEQCTFSQNQDTGLQLSGGSSFNRIINCDSYLNRDPGQGNADGFAPKLDVGTGNYFYGCRSWQNSDDGWDGYMRPPGGYGADTMKTMIVNCWSFMNGYLIDGSVGTGNGNGFKMGGSDSANLRHHMTLVNCLTFDNKSKGFDENNNRGTMLLYNCTSYGNTGNNFSIPGPIAAAETVLVENCAELGGKVLLGSFAVQTTDSWLLASQTTSADFISIDTTGVTGPRKSDGSLPDVSFMHLAQGSHLVDAGTNIGLPYEGNAPDIGAFESNWTSTVAGVRGLAGLSFRLEQNFPNPFNPSTVVSFELRVSSDMSLTIYDILGREITTLVAGRMETGIHRATFNASGLPSGIYFARLNAGTLSQTIKLLLVR